MVKNILGVIVGYIVMFVFVFITFGLAFMILGTEGSFKPGSYDVSGIWIVISIILGFIAAVLGGLVCTMISKNIKATMVLAAVVLVLGVAMAVPTLSDSGAADTQRAADVPMMEAMQKADQPSWLAFLNPILGAIGTMVGGRLRKPASPTAGAPAAPAG
ncbi:hypothetical protein GF420_16510 [candidate division GN15 bacterium]|nr:hypothetical protein [candidate division GN15 bacterium]